MSNTYRIVVVMRALYGLKSSTLQFRNFLTDILPNRMGFSSSLADPDLWYKAVTKSDGSEYYSYILVYVEDVLIIDEDQKQFMKMNQGLDTWCRHYTYSNT